MIQRYVPHVGISHEGNPVPFMSPVGGGKPIFEVECVTHHDHLAALEAARREAREGALADVQAWLDWKLEFAAQHYLPGDPEVLIAERFREGFESEEYVGEAAKRPEPEGGEVGA